MLSSALAGLFAASEAAEIPNTQYSKNAKYGYEVSNMTNTLTRRMSRFIPRENNFWQNSTSAYDRAHRSFYLGCRLQPAADWEDYF